MNTSLAMRSTTRSVVVALLVARGDVEKGDLVGTLLIVAARDFDGSAWRSDVRRSAPPSRRGPCPHREGNDSIGESHQRPSLDESHPLRPREIERAFVDRAPVDRTDIVRSTIARE
jgi:hypothetical protein